MKSLAKLLSMRVFYQRLFFVLLLVVTILSLIPNPESVPGGSWFAEFLAKLFLGDAHHADKINHFIAYGGLAGCAALAGFRLFGKQTLLLVALILYSGGIELAQGLTSQRHPDWLDMIANSSGVVCGYIAALLLVSLVARYPQNS